MILINKKKNGIRKIKTEKNEFWKQYNGIWEKIKRIL